MYNTLIIIVCYSIVNYSLVWFIVLHAVALGARATDDQRRAAAQ